MQGRAESSRESTAGAGWECVAGSFRALVPERARPFSWLSPRPLWQSRNDRLARAFGDPTDERRRAWMARLAPADPDLLVSVPTSGAYSFLGMGDTGEGDGSQFCVVPPLLAQSADATFLFICSDVIYPAGGIDEYRDKFFAPYAEHTGRIYAVPGNHDWYDDATGFMYWFCGAEGAPPRPRGRPLSKAWIRDRLWRRAPRPGADVVAQASELRGGRLGQPAPYFAIDVGELRLVGIDTGITGTIDRDQAAWLRRISKGPRPKVLLTGKPIYVDGVHRPGKIEGEQTTIDAVVTDPDHHYLAVVGGDIHNYQRYPVGLADGRTIVYLVSGAGGSFMHETYSIDNIDETELADRVTEARFRCYPLRGDCLSRFSQLYARKLRLIGGQRLLYIRPDAAAAIMSKRLGVQATRPSAQTAKPTLRERISAAIVLRLPGRGKRGLHLPFSEWLDWNEPPMFKSFLRFDADDGELTIRCFAANGCASQEHDPPVEDTLRARRGADGRWEWTF